MMQKWWSVFGYTRELLTRVMPIVLLVIANIILIGIVRSSRNRMKKNRGTALKHTPSNLTIPTHETTEFLENKTNNNTNMTDKNTKGKNVCNNKKTTPNRNRQENQLTTMTIFVAIMYVISSIPMVYFFIEIKNLYY
jgi:hypothetical protein